MIEPAEKREGAGFGEGAGKDGACGAEELLAQKSVEIQIALLNLGVPQIALPAPVELDTVQAVTAVFLCSAQQKPFDCRQLELEKSSGGGPQASELSASAELSTGISDGAALTAGCEPDR